MVKIVEIFRLKPGIDADAAYRVWREKHTVWMRDKILPRARRYTMNRVIHKYPPAGGTVADFDIYGYAMTWFDDLASALSAADRLRSAPPDAFLTAYVMPPKMVIVEEETIAL